MSREEAEKWIREHHYKPGGPVKCDICKRTIDPQARNIFRLVTGWVQKRAGGGTNTVRLPSEHDIWAHKTCVDLAASGISSQQESLM